MSADKYASIFSRQMEAIVYIFSPLMEAIVFLNIFRNTRSVEIGEHITNSSIWRGKMLDICSRTLSVPRSEN